MGYSLSIERVEGKNKITKEEWDEYVKSDPELESITEHVVNVGNGKSLKICPPNGGLALWNKKVLFSYYKESARIKSGSEDFIIEKMISIAKKLDAVVRGDEGEIYDDNWLKNRNAVLKAKRKSWWKFWS